MRTSRAPPVGQGAIPARNERQTNFKVVVRIRPPLPREMSGEISFKNIAAVDAREQVVTVSDSLEAVLDERGELLSNTGPYTSHSFVFDYVYDQSSSQKKVYETSARTGVESALHGYNATIFAYGQTGTGKTYTMEGFNNEMNSVEARGIIPRAIEQIFGHIQRNISPRMRFLVRASYLQIYNEVISDLLKEKTNLHIREDKKRGVYVDGLSEWVVRSPAEIYGLMQRGGSVRATGETKMNEISSRSHAVFIVIVEQSETVYVDESGNEMSADEFNKMMYSRGVRREGDMGRLEDQVRQSFKIGKLNLVDLAGSERVRLSGATGQRLEESKKINKSLSALGNVISALTETKERAHIPYRDSKLTRVLEDSLGGNCKTTMMAMISPALEAMTETLSTLKFANRAKNIKNEAKINEDLDQKSLLRKYERELKKLRAELEARSKNVVDKRRLLELDEQRRRAEADKMAAMRALEMRSKEFMQEKEEKKRLEQRIAMLTSQMIRGERGHGPGGDANGLSGDAVAPEMQVLMKEQHDRLRHEYEGKLADLERERETIVEEKAQVDRYKQLLLKQRDIMIALTQRLVERDEQIVSLQDELDAYDKHHKELEEKLDEKTAMLIKFQRIAVEVNAKSPFKNDELSLALDSWSKENFSREATNTATELEDEEYNGYSSSMLTPANGSLYDRTERAEKIDRPSALRPDAGSQMEEMVKREWSSCLRRIQKDLEANDDSSVAVYHMTNMISDVLGNIRSTVSLQGNHPEIARTRGPVSQDKYDELIAENRKLSAKLRDYVSSKSSQSAQRPTDQEGSDNEEHRMLRNRCEVLVKERQAVHTIMEQKIKVLVQSVAHAVGVVLNSTQGAGPTGHALAKDVAALQRLVNASIAALRNAAATSLPKNDSPAPTTNGQDRSQSEHNNPRSQSAGRLYSHRREAPPSPIQPPRQMSESSSSYVDSGGYASSTTYRPPLQSQHTHIPSNEPASRFKLDTGEASRSASSEEPSTTSFRGKSTAATFASMPSSGAADGGRYGSQSVTGIDSQRTARITLRGRNE